jgi:hypothetical protein
MGDNIKVNLREVMWGEVCTGLIWLRKRPVLGFFGHGNELSGSVKRGEFCD